MTWGVVVALNMSTQMLGSRLLSSDGRYRPDWCPSKNHIWQGDRRHIRFMQMDLWYSFLLIVRHKDFVTEIHLPVSKYRIKPSKMHLKLRKMIELQDKMPES
jgi:hypothetical protein